MKESQVSVLVGDGVVTLKREGTRRAVVANVLGRIERDGIELLCLDRLVHEAHEKAFVGWNVSGAVTTMLSRAIPTNVVTAV
ncbi:hypothetical protein [Paraburkholderia atlantica]|uniref:Uncharacterized protein n=1 Tax=Paraburkholderia atlantica TaxID=2654982 RepID=D5WNW0_PARAM|nr:hypothetical protein [Paraburkholderia atlantica]ADG20989.1 conserved hypothetical protein [Paraburkholderia atlantica]MBB5511193.1 nucleoside diphosphate kinase [Paraburkholderia atlantica]